MSWRYDPYADSIEPWVHFCLEDSRLPYVCLIIMALSASHGEAISVPCKGLRQDLGGHLSIQLGVGGAIDLPHAPLAELCDSKKALI